MKKVILLFLSAMCLPFSAMASSNAYSIKSQESSCQGETPYVENYTNYAGEYVYDGNTLTVRYIGTLSFGTPKSGFHELQKRFNQTYQLSNNSYSHTFQDHKADANGTYDFVENNVDTVQVAGDQLIVTEQTTTLNTITYKDGTVDIIKGFCTIKTTAIKNS